MIENAIDAIDAIDSMYLVQSGMLHVFVNGMGPDNLVRTMSRGQIVSVACLAYHGTLTTHIALASQSVVCGSKTISHASLTLVCQGVSEWCVCVCARASGVCVCNDVTWRAGGGASTVIAGEEKCDSAGENGVYPGYHPHGAAPRVGHY